MAHFQSKGSHGSSPPKHRKTVFDFLKDANLPSEAKLKGAAWAEVVGADLGADITDLENSQPASLLVSV